MIVCQLKGDSISEVPPFPSCPQQVVGFSCCYPCFQQFPYSLFHEAAISSLHRHILCSLQAASKQMPAGCGLSHRNAIHRPREQWELRRTDLAGGGRLWGRQLQKIKSTCFIEGVFTYRIRSCLTLLKLWSAVAVLEQLLNGLVQTAAGEHQKVQWSSADKHPNCLILSYPQA